MNTTTVLSITTALGFLAAGYFGYQSYTMNQDLRAFHDNINKLPQGSTSIPVAIIPKGLMDAMNAMK